MPSFEEIWPSRGPMKRIKRGIEYYVDVSGDNDDDVDDNYGVDDDDDKQGTYKAGQEGRRILP